MPPAYDSMPCTLREIYDFTWIFRFWYENVMTKNLSMYQSTTVLKFLLNTVHSVILLYFTFYIIMACDWGHCGNTESRADHQV